MRQLFVVLITILLNACVSMWDKDELLQLGTQSPTYKSTIDYEKLNESLIKFFEKCYTSPTQLKMNGTNISSAPTFLKQEKLNNGNIIWLTRRAQSKIIYLLKVEVINDQNEPTLTAIANSGMANIFDELEYITKGGNPICPVI